MSLESGSWLTIGRDTAEYTRADAEAVLAGFAFGTTQLTWSPKAALSADRELAAGPRARARSMWSYRTYDCLPNSPSAFGVTDLLAVAALDAGAGGADYLAMEAVLPDLNEVLSHVDVGQTFWALPRADLGATPTADTGTPSWWLWRAWALLTGLKGVGVAIAYKTLHHKRPWFFPVFDNDTVAKMGGKCAWQVLHQELASQVVQFTHLEQWFAAEATKRGGVHLTRLRIHDILLWGAIARDGVEREALIRAGHEALG
jgi:hypothetical protein